MASSPVIPYSEAPATILNQALDMIGAREETILGSLNDGTRVAEVARRNYGQILRQMLRANHWPFARQMTQLTLLGDATGASSPPVSPNVEPPWAYGYAWPTDAVQGRWMPAGPMPLETVPSMANGTPITTGGGDAPWNVPLLPGRFLVGTTNLYPIEIGTVAWDQMPDLQRTEGLGPVYRKVIWTNVQNALFVYTRLVTTIEEWDDGFRQAMVTALALSVVMTAIEDRKEAITQRNELIAILKNTLADARAQSGNEGGYPQSTDHQPIWLTARNGGWWGWGWGNLGGQGNLGLYTPWEPFSLSGSVF